MMQLGQAAGTAVAIARREKLDALHLVPSGQLRTELQQQHVELSWPRPSDLVDYLSVE
jgi:hypothetical protein